MKYSKHENVDVINYDIVESLTDDTDTDSDSEVFNYPLPLIPDDKFIMEITTWDEYSVSKGFPENDKYTYALVRDGEKHVKEYDYQELRLLNLYKTCVS